MVTPPVVTPPVVTPPVVTPPPVVPPVVTPPVVTPPVVTPPVVSPPVQFAVKVPSSIGTVPVAVRTVVSAPASSAVAQSTSPVVGTSLARTGANTWLLMLVAMLALILGSVLVVSSRRFAIDTAVRN